MSSPLERYRSSHDKLVLHANLHFANSLPRSKPFHHWRGPWDTNLVVELDGDKTLMAVGDIGELWLEGPLVGQDYLNDPERTNTSQSFIRETR
jgi:hypothetical protein